MDPEPVADNDSTFRLQEAEEADLQQAFRDQVVAPRVAACVCLHRLSRMVNSQDAAHGADDQQAAGKGPVSLRDSISNSQMLDWSNIKDILLGLLTVDRRVASWLFFPNYGSACAYSTLPITASKCHRSR